MSTFFMTWLATPAASLSVGVIGLVVLIRLGRHRDAHGHISRLRVSSALMFSAVAYTLTMILIGYFGLHVRLVDVIANGFGEERVAWLFVVMLVDVGVRLAQVYDGRFQGLIEDI